MQAVSNLPISTESQTRSFRKDIHSEKGWKFDILCMRSPGVKGICADALLCDSLSCQSLRFVVEARSVGFCRGSRVTCRGSRVKKCFFVRKTKKKMFFRQENQN